MEKLGAQICRCTKQGLNTWSPGVERNIGFLCITYVPPGLKSLRGTVSVLETVFVGQCEVFVCLDFVLAFVFSLAAKLMGPRMGRQFFKNVDFSVTYPLKSVSCSMSYLRGDGVGFGDSFCRTV